MPTNRWRGQRAHRIVEALVSTRGFGFGFGFALAFAPARAMAFALALAAALLAAPAMAADALTQPGTWRTDFRHDGRVRSYLVHIPPGYDPVQPTPVLLALHGGGGHMDLMAGPAYGIAAKADREGFIAVFPNGTGPLPSGKLATWNAGRCCAWARDHGTDDVGFLRAVVERLRSQVHVDADRIFATGMSNGGMMSHRLACEMADVLRAVAAVAGTDATLQCNPARPISVLQIHARDDERVPYEGGAGSGSARHRERVTAYVSVPDTVEHWRQRSRCDGAPELVLQADGARCEASTRCAGGAQVQLCTTETGGHGWPGGGTVRRRKGPPTQALSANDVMWDFFSRVAPR